MLPSPLEIKCWSWQSCASGLPSFIAGTRGDVRGAGGPGGSCSRQSCSIGDGTGAGACPPLHPASSWTLVLRVLVPAGLRGERAVCGPRPHPVPVPTPCPLTWLPPLYAKLLFRASTTASGWGNFSLRGGPFPMPLHSSTAAETRGDGSGLPGSAAPRRPARPPALTAAVLLHQRHLEAAPARRPRVDLHGELRHGPAQRRAQRRRVAPEHPSALAGGGDTQSRGSAPRGVALGKPPPAPAPLTSAR